MENKRPIMQMYARDYRATAEEKCKKFSSRLAIIYLIYMIITGAINSVFSYTTDFEGIEISFSYGSILGIFVMGPFVASLIKISKKVYKGEEPQVDELFTGFKDYGNNFVLYLLQRVYIALWSLLFVIPGLIKTYSYAMAFYIKEDNPELTANECITKSREMMDGHKWELFCLEFSYLGWLILCALTLGILSLWVGPKMELAKYTFYRNISGQGLKDQPEEFEIEEDQFTIKIE